jgi:hypothetical protein
MKGKENLMKIKKLPAILLTMTIVLSLSATGVFAASNESLTTSDALTVLRASVGLATLTAEQMTRYGISSEPSTIDALRILRISVGLTTTAPPVSTTPPSSSINTIGNTSANIYNWGLAAIQGDWIYYANLNDGQKLYKIKTDNTGRAKVSDDIVMNINVVGDWIYYSGNGGDGWSIYKIRTDGTGRTNLNVNGGLVNVIGDLIFYKADDALYRMKTDGTGNVKLVDNFTNYSIVGDWIYYTANMIGETYRMRTDGSDKQMEYTIEFLYFMQDDLFFGGSPFVSLSVRRKSNNNWSENGRVLEFGGTSYIGVGGDWLYFSVGENDGSMNPYVYKPDVITAENLEKGIYKIKSDGTGFQKLNNDIGELINVVGDWVYYQIPNDGLYRMRTDGTQRQKVT